MALVSTAVNVSNQDAVPATKLNPQKKGGAIRTAFGYLAAADFTGGTTGQWYTFVRVPARARVTSIKVTNPTSTTGAVKIGLYRPNGIAISDAVFATAFVLGAANNEAAVDTVRTPLQRTQTLADAFVTAIGTAGATSDVEFDIAAAIVTVIGTPVAAILEVNYVLPE